jgi:hypothetical protein
VTRRSNKASSYRLLMLNVMKCTGLFSLLTIREDSWSGVPGQLSADGNVLTFLHT